MTILWNITYFFVYLVVMWMLHLTLLIFHDYIDAKKIIKDSRNNENGIHPNRATRVW